MFRLERDRSRLRRSFIHGSLPSGLDVRLQILWSVPHDIPCEYMSRHGRVIVAVSQGKDQIAAAYSGHD